MPDAWQTHQAPQAGETPDGDERGLHVMGDFRNRFSHRREAFSSQKGLTPLFLFFHQVSQQECDTDKENAFKKSAEILQRKAIPVLNRERKIENHDQARSR